jgi:hypothetical protein
MNGTRKEFVVKFSLWQRIRALVLVGVVGIGSIALIYFIPAPPSKVVMATAFKGASFEYYGRQYQEIFARSHVELELRETAGAVENLKLLQDSHSDVQIAFVTGGLSDAKHTPGCCRSEPSTISHSGFFIRRISKLINSHNSKANALPLGR